MPEFGPVELELHETGQGLGLIEQFLVELVAALLLPFLFLNGLENARRLFPFHQKSVGGVIGEASHNQKGNAHKGHHPTGQQEAKGSHDGDLPTSAGVFSSRSM